LYYLRSFFLRCRPCGNSVPELYQEGRRSAPDANRTRQAETSAGLNCPPLNAALLDRYFNYYIECGFLPPPGSASTRPSSRDLARKLPARWPASCPDPQGSACFEDAAFLERLLRRHFADDALRVRELALLNSGSDHSIVSD
jgi:hypothetical protein